MKKEVNIRFSEQARLALRNMPNISEQEVLDWFINKRCISVGGGDIYDYLRYKENGVK